MKHPAIALGMDSDIIAFCRDLVDHGAVDALEPAILGDPHSIFVDRAPKRALKDKVCFVAVDRPRKGIRKAREPALVPRYSWRGEFGNEIEAAGDVNGMNAIG